MEKLLEVKNLRVSYHTYAGEVQSVRGINFSVYPGETVALVGESGCGKSVTAKSLVGLLSTPPAEIKEGSEILYSGENILKYSKKQWSEYRGGECAMVFQDALAALNPTMTVGWQIGENLQIHKGLTKKQAQEQAISMLEQVGIPNARERAKQYPHEFSGGMRQRVMIAIALACSPKLLIADEPTTALDVTLQAQILELLRSLQQKMGTSIILITHDLGVVADVADRIIVMYSGKIVEQGNCRDIFYYPHHPYTRALLSAVPRIDSERKKKLTTIAGTPPDLLVPPKGCPFSTRCEHCMNICASKMPPVYQFEEGHTSACWLHHPKAPQQEETFFARGGIPCQSGRNQF